MIELSTWNHVAGFLPLRWRMDELIWGKRVEDGVEVVRFSEKGYFLVSNTLQGTKITRARFCVFWPLLAPYSWSISLSFSRNLVYCFSFLPHFSQMPFSHFFSGRMAASSNKSLDSWVARIVFTQNSLVFLT